MNRLAAIMVLNISIYPAWGMAVVEFSPGPDNAGATRIPSFDQQNLVNHAGSNSDGLVGTKVLHPYLEIMGSSGHYNLTPVGTADIMIIDGCSTKTYIHGTLTPVDLLTIGTMAGGYSQFMEYSSAGALGLLRWP